VGRRRAHEPSQADRDRLEEVAELLAVAFIRRKLRKIARPGRGAEFSQKGLELPGGAVTHGVGPENTREAS